MLFGRRLFRLWSLSDLLRSCRFPERGRADRRNYSPRRPHRKEKERARFKLHDDKAFEINAIVSLPLCGVMFASGIMSGRPGRAFRPCGLYRPISLFFFRKNTRTVSSLKRGGMNGEDGHRAPLCPRRRRDVFQKPVFCSLSSGAKRTGLSF